MIEDRIFSVYIHKFPNGKQYVGITSTEPKKRWANGRGYMKNTEMYKDICLYKWDNIEHIIVNDNCEYFYNEEEASLIEKDFVASWDLTNPNKGYNLTSGGTSSFKLHKNTKKKISDSHKNSKKSKTNLEKQKKAVIQYNLQGYKIKEYSSVREASRILKIDSSYISKVCKGKGFSAGGYIWRHKDENSQQNITPKILYFNKQTKKEICVKKNREFKKDKPVIQYSMEMKELKIYPSVIVASKEVKNTVASILRVCRNKQISASGFRWRFEDNRTFDVSLIMKKIRKPLNSKKVIQYDLDWNVIQEFPSIVEAAREMGISDTRISAVCNGRKKTAGGFRWSFK